jgi:5-formyltetrahydrofolate cyclo-ligase
MAPAPSLVEEKRVLRRAMSDRRAALAAEERADRAVAGFLAIRSEIDPAEALAEVGRRGGTVVYPRVSAGQPRLRFHWVAGPDDLRPGAYGILEPQEACPEVAPRDLDVILLPGLAFDAAGRRLGYGGGYYDEVGGLVRREGRALLLGVGFDFQVIDRCPAGDGDVTIDGVVTDARVVRCRGEAAP